MEKSTIHILLFILSTMLSVGTYAQNTYDTPLSDSLSADTLMPWDQRLKQSLSAFASEAESSYFTTGMCVYDLTADTLLFAYNQHKVMRPASTQKLITAISALDLLGAQYEYRTRGFYTGRISTDGILHGDIYIVGDFDPTYSYADLKGLAETIRKQGIRGIDGSLYADISMKDSLLYGNGWCWDDVPSDNQPYLCPLMLQRGTLSPEWKKYSTSPTFHPAIHFLTTLGQELKDIGGDTLRCSLRPLQTQVSPRLFYNKGVSIADLLPEMMKMSDNLYAESMLFHIAHINNGRWATWKDGARLIGNVFRKANVQTQYVEVADGSGVSLYNYISPEAELAMLIYAYRHRDIFDTLYPALPVAGIDGTLRSRMTDGPAHGNIHAKTGSVSGVSCLAGYLTASNGHLLAFSIMNNGLMRGATGRAFQDRICQELAR